MNIPESLSLNEIAEQKTNLPDCPYIRVGDDYYKKIMTTDPLGFPRSRLRHIKRITIIDDFGKDYLKKIPHYDDFDIVPSNLNHKQVVNGCYNLYSPICHIPKPGEWKWTRVLLEQVFGDQYQLGLRYMQILYLHPDRQTIILALVSKERSTGKTTFLNWLSMLFQNNVTTLSSTDFTSTFNGYAQKNILCIEEALLDSKMAINKIKAITTAKNITINEKYVPQYTIPFFGKVVIASNNEDNFVRIDHEEIRYLIRRLGPPKTIKHDIEMELLKEIPAFLHYLTTLDPVDWSVSRSGFTPEELQNKFLIEAVEESRTALAKDLEINIIEHFESNPNGPDHFFAVVGDIKKAWFAGSGRVEANHIRRVLKKEFGLLPVDQRRYTRIDGTEANGRPFLFEKDKFCNK